MALMSPDSIDHLDGTTAGERRVFNFLRIHLPDNYYVFYDAPVQGRYPDFIVVGPDLGIVILEVKDWQIESIISADKDVFRLRTTGRKQTNPYKQARGYMMALLDTLNKYPQLKQESGEYKGNPKFNYGYGAILANISEQAWVNSDRRDSIPVPYRMFKSDLDLLENKKNSHLLRNHLKRFIHAEKNFTNLSALDLELIASILSRGSDDRNRRPDEGPEDESPNPVPHPGPKPPRSSIPEKKNRMPFILSLLALISAYAFLQTDFFRQLSTGKKDSSYVPVPSVSEPPKQDFRTDPVNDELKKLMNPTIPFADMPMKTNNVQKENTNRKHNYSPPTEDKRRASASAVSKEGLWIKGNISKNGEYIYHMPGQRYYDKTIPERWFKTEQEAIVAGYRKSKI